MSSTQPERTSFHSDYHVVGQLPAFDQATIAAEPALRHAPVPWAREHGGPIVQAFLDALPAAWLAHPETVVRVKSAWLRRGWSPGGIGWHLDSVLGPGQGRDWARARHPEFCRYACHFGADAPTRFAVGTLVIPLYPPGLATEALWHDHVEKALAGGQIRAETVADGVLVRLNPGSIHSVNFARDEGWRVFVDSNNCRVSSVVPFEGVYSEVHNECSPRSAHEFALMGDFLSGLR